MTKQFQEMTNEELALAYVNGNNDAFDILLERTKGPVFSYILYIVHDKSLADDFFQETFVKVIVSLQEGKYSTSGKFLAWVVRIAHNIIMDNYREQRSHSIFNTDSDDETAMNLASLFVHCKEDSIVNSQTMEDVKKLMMDLPQQQREVVFMRFFQDLSFKDIAEATGVSINTSLGRMRYAIQNMRRAAKQQNLVLEF